MTLKAILTDIEGTTSAIDFVHQVLFPYAKEHLEDFVFSRYKDPQVADCILAVGHEIGQPEAQLQTIVQTLMSWIAEDRKATPLKTLQGLIWEQGYRSGALQGHIYEDAMLELKQWKAQGLSLYVYSSGSVQAQCLLFQHTRYGDLTGLFNGYFDTHMGPKQHVQSYTNIVQQIDLSPQQVLFLSDVEAELEAAQQAGLEVCLLQRDAVQSTVFPYARDFAEIVLSR